MKFSVIIPTLNDGPQIGSALKRLREISRDSPMEVIVVDGGSDDDTVAEARPLADAIVAHGRPDRASQMNAGVERARGDLYLFLAADAQPPGNWQQALEHFWLKAHQETIAATAFTVDYGSGFSFRTAAFLYNALSRWSGRAVCDQGLCTTPELFRASGGFPENSPVDDLIFCARLRSLGKIAVLPDRIWAAARPMRRKGPWASILRRAWLEAGLNPGVLPRAGTSPR